jgi:hypothetical protein
MPLFLLIALLITGTSYASEPSPWPKPVSVEVQFKESEPYELPHGLAFSEITVEGHDPHPIGLGWLDINGDGNAELLVDSNEGGTGGSYKMIFQKGPSGYKRIAALMGGFSFVQAENGYFQIESWSSAGGGDFSRALYTYHDGRYRMTRLEDWRGFGDDDGWKYIRSRNPKEHDNE